MYPFKFDLDQSFIQICFKKKTKLVFQSFKQICFDETKMKMVFNLLNIIVLMKST